LNYNSNNNDDNKMNPKPNDYCFIEAAWAIAHGCSADPTLAINGIDVVMMARPFIPSLSAMMPLYGACLAGITNAYGSQGGGEREDPLEPAVKGLIVSATVDIEGEEREEILLNLVRSCATCGADVSNVVESIMEDVQTRSKKYYRAATGAMSRALYDGRVEAFSKAAKDMVEDDTNGETLWAGGQIGVTEMHGMSIHLAIGHLKNCVDAALEDEDVVDLILITGNDRSKLNYGRGIQKTIMKIGGENGGCVVEESGNEGRLRVVGKTNILLLKGALENMNEGRVYDSILN